MVLHSSLIFNCISYLSFFIKAYHGAVPEQSLMSHVLLRPKIRLIVVIMSEFEHAHSLFLESSLTVRTK